MISDKEGQLWVADNLKRLQVVYKRFSAKQQKLMDRKNELESNYKENRNQMVIMMEKMSSAHLPEFIEVCEKTAVTGREYLEAEKELNEFSKKGATISDAMEHLEALADFFKEEAGKLMEGIDESAILKVSAYPLIDFVICAAVDIEMEEIKHFYTYQIADVLREWGLTDWDVERVSRVLSNDLTCKKDSNVSPVEQHNHGRRKAWMLTDVGQTHYLEKLSSLHQQLKNKKS